MEQPDAGHELRAIKRHLGNRANALPWLFVFERGQLLTRRAINYFVAEAAGRAGLPGVHPHTLRHSFEFILADESHGLCFIQNYLGQGDLRHTVHCTWTAGWRFKGSWQ